MDPYIGISNGRAREVALSARYGHDCRKVAMPRVILQWTRKGYGIYEDADGIRRVEKGAVFVIIAPEDARYYYPKGETEPWLFDWIDLTGELASSLLRAFKQRYGAVVPLDAKGTAGILWSRILLKMEKGELRSPGESSRAVYDFILAWWREAATAEKGQSLSSVIEACAGNGLSRFMTIKELAAECGMTREHFTRCFTKEMGVSPSSWLRRQRLLTAATMLIDHPELTLSAVAREAGFATVRHFSASFQRAYGTTAGEYRRVREQRSH